VIGADRRSPALLRLIADLNTAAKTRATLVTSDPGGGFCRSDQWSYSRLGIPVAFFTTGSHADYHSVTDEAEYIDYAKLALVTRFVAEVTMALADTLERLEPRGQRVVLTAFCSG
jgi:acetylornithine deacetylase/succinyl-diaminopimelate desuccinylase-like protein